MPRCSPVTTASGTGTEWTSYDAGQDRSIPTGSSCDSEETTDGVGTAPSVLLGLKTKRLAPTLTIIRESPNNNYKFARLRRRGVDGAWYHYCVTCHSARKAGYEYRRNSQEPEVGMKGGQIKHIFVLNGEVIEESGAHLTAMQTDD